MSQMDLLVTNVAELLTAAVQDVLQLMGQAVLEYQKESSRTRLENLSLQQKLKELQERTAEASDEISFSGDDPHSLEDHPQEDLIYHEDSPVSEEAQQPECVRDNRLHMKLVLDEVTFGHQHKSLQVISDCSLKKQRPLSRPLKRVLNPSPASRETPATSSITAPSDPHRLKVESSPEPQECSVKDDVASRAPHVPIPSLVDEDCQQPVSCFPSNIIHYNQPSKLVDSTSDHILRSWVENTVGVHSAPSISESSHSCHVCGKTFASASSLGAHFVCHSNERPFVCKCCKFRFSRLADLKKHERIHTGERPYNCSLCGRRFNRTENLRRHLRKVHYGAVL